MADWENALPFWVMVCSAAKAANTPPQMQPAARAAIIIFIEALRCLLLALGLALSRQDGDCGRRHFARERIQEADEVRFFLIRQFQRPYVLRATWPVDAALVI